MKKRATILALLMLLGSFTFAQSFAYFEAGYLPSISICDYSEVKAGDYLSADGAFYADVGGRVFLLPFIFIGGNTKCYMLKTSYNAEFWPVYASYTVNVGLVIGDNFEAGFEHQCSHPVYAMGYLSLMDEPIISKDEDYNKFYVRATVKF